MVLIKSAQQLHGSMLDREGCDTTSLILAPNTAINKQLPHRGSREIVELVSWCTYSYANRLSVFQECVLPTDCAGLMLGFLSRIRKHERLK